TSITRRRWRWQLLDSGCKLTKIQEKVGRCEHTPAISEGTRRVSRITLPTRGRVQAVRAAPPQPAVDCGCPPEYEYADLRLTAAAYVSRLALERRRFDTLLDIRARGGAN